MMAVTGEILTDDPGFELRFDEVYDTDADDLWEAITTPARLGRWMADYRGDLRLGGRWQALTRGGDVYCDGEVTACERPHGFATTWTVVGQPMSLLTVRLEPVDAGRTRLRLRHERVTRPDYGPGWHTYLESLAWHLADPGAPKDRDRWDRRFAELEPGYAARLAALTPPAP
ncbi:MULTISPECIES: SRPBCC domain-containing protein [unclassified Agromyces]|uniref:SRPBCC domain-containing protein n=1 Tax=unclassified Agromyces TaxID=2639701 RepID=UPI003014F23B